MSEVNKNNLKIRKKIKILNNFSDYLGPWNHVSKIPRGTGCIAPKLRGAQVEGSKNPRGKGWVVQNSAGQILKANLPRKVLDPSTCAPQSFGPLNLCPAEFWSNATCGPRSFGDIVSGPQKTTKMI